MQLQFRCSISDSTSIIEMDTQKNKLIDSLIVPYKVAHSSFRVLLDTFLHVKTQGLEHIPKEGGAVLVCNHSDMIDILIQGVYAGRRVSFLAKQEAGDYKRHVEKIFQANSPLMSLPQFKWIRPMLKNTLMALAEWMERNYIEWGQPVNFEREFHKNMTRKEAMEYYEQLEDHLVSLLKEGLFLSIFPEGTRTTTGLMAPFKSIATRVALKARVPIIPSGLSGCWKFSTLENFISGRVFRNPIQFNVGRPHFMDSETIENEKEFIKKITSLLEREVYQLSTNTYDM